MAWKPTAYSTGVKRWVNVARDGDVVCADKTLGDEYKASGKALEDIYIDDWDWMPAAHNIASYLSYTATRTAVAAAVDRARFQQVGVSTITRGLAESLDENA